MLSASFSYWSSDLSIMSFATASSEASAASSPQTRMDIFFSTSLYKLNTLWRTFLLVVSLAQVERLALFSNDAKLCLIDDL